ncbi:MAG: hypothetical protein IJ629_04810 [Clostridia bacterium]|nr:hypothetical protein [Clostridia bacterium]
MKFFNIFKSRKGLTGADVAAAITVIVLTVGIVTAIYVNTINKSKDNLRFANATRIATNIMENIQKKPYEYLIGICAESGNSVTAGGGSKIFDTKIPNGFKAKVTAAPASGAAFDVARDVTINVTYKANTTYKTITLNSVKQKELIDMTNSPDITLIPTYKLTNSSKYYYPVKKVGSEYIVTTISDIEWYDYEEGKYALIFETESGDLNVGASIKTVIGTTYAWIPRFVSKTSGTAGINQVKFLYGSSDYRIELNAYGNLFAYGVKYKDATITASSVPLKYDQKDDGSEDLTFTYTSFAGANEDYRGDGLSGVWYQIGGENSEKMGNSEKTVQEIATDFSTKTGFALPTN